VIGPLKFEAVLVAKMSQNIHGTKLFKNVRFPKLCSDFDKTHFAFDVRHTNGFPNPSDTK